MDKTEIKQIQDFLRRSFDCAQLRLMLNPKNPETADLYLGERNIAQISVDDEDGDRSFAMEMKLPVEKYVLQDYLRKLFGTSKLNIVPHGRKTDSVELNTGDQYLGVISADDAKGKSYTLQIAILDVDLEGI